MRMYSINPGRRKAVRKPSKRMRRLIALEDIASSLSMIASNLYTIKDDLTQHHFELIQTLRELKK